MSKRFTVITDENGDQVLLQNTYISGGKKRSVFPTQTGNATPPSVGFNSTNANFEAKMVTSTAASCVVTLYGTNESGDITNGVLLGTFSLSTTAADTAKSFGAVSIPYLEVYGVIASSTGTITSIDFNWIG